MKTGSIEVNKATFLRLVRDKKEVFGYVQFGVDQGHYVKLVKEDVKAIAQVVFLECNRISVLVPSIDSLFIG